MLSENYIVEKSYPVVELSYGDWDLPTLKLLDIYLSKLDARRPETAEVLFTPEEYAEVLGTTMKNIGLQQLDGILTRLARKTIDAHDAEYNNTDHRPAFASCGLCVIDGKRYIRIKCAEESKDLFFNLQRQRYLTYELKNVLRIHRMNTYVLYTFLLKQAYRGRIELTIPDARVLLLCEKAYPQFKDFWKWAVEPAVKELNEKTNLHCEVSKVLGGYHGREVCGLIFHVRKTDNLLPETEEKELVDGLLTLPPATATTPEYEMYDELTLDERTEPKAREYINDVTLFRDAVEGSGFSDAEVDSIATIARYWMPKEYIDIAPGRSPDLALYHYIEERWMQIRGRKSIKYPYKYLCSLLKGKGDGSF